MSDYSLTLDDIQLVLSSMLKARLIASAHYQDIIFQPVDLPGDTILEPGNLGLKIEDIQNLAVQAGNMFGCSLELSVGYRMVDWALAIYDCRQKKSLPQIVFSTSGSTGQPQQIAHDYQLLEQEIGCQLERILDIDRIVSFVFPHHIYGFLFTVLLPRIAGYKVVSLPPFVTPTATERIQPGDLVVGFPLLWDKFLDVDIALPESVWGVTSTAPCPAATIQGLKRLGFEQVMEIYGSSETGGIGTRNCPESPYELLSCWTKDSEDQICKIHPATQKRILFTVPDNLQWESQSRFYPVGRRDKAVQVAGKNVYPEKIEQLLLTHPQIKECMVRLMRPEEGNRLKAFIVPEDMNDHKTLAKEIKNWMATRFEAAQIPKKIDIGLNLPHNAMGKKQDW